MTLLLALLLAATPTARPTARPDAGVDAPLASSAVDGGTANLTPLGADELPQRLTVEDAFLAALPPAPVNVESWDQAVQLLRNSSTQLRLAKERLRIAEGHSLSALSGVLPSIDASASVQWDLLHPGQPPPLIGVDTTGTAGGEGAPQLTVPLGYVQVAGTLPLISTRAWNQISTLKAQERSAAAADDDTQRTELSSLARTLVSVATAERVAEVSRGNLRAALEREVLAVRNFEGGGGTRLDVYRVQQDVALARTDVINGAESVRRAREALGILLGKAEPMGVLPNVDLLGLKELAAQSCRTLDALPERADLRSRAADVDAAKAVVRDGYSQYLPNIALQSSVYGLTVDPGTLVVPTWNLSAVFSWTLFDGLNREGQLKSNAAQARAAEDTYELASRSVTVEAEQARRQVEVATSLFREATRSRDLAKQTDALTQRAYLAGQGTSLELVQTAAVLRQAELQLTLAEFNVVLARVNAFFVGATCRL